MKVQRHKNSVLIISNSLCTFLSTLTGFASKKDGKPAMGFAIPPFFIVLRNLTHPMTKQWLNHKSIHVREFIESLGVFWVISKLEYLYARLFLKYSHYKAHRYECMEQEAYLNQHDDEYLSNRPLFNTVEYIKTKTLFHTDDKYRIVIEKKH